MKLSTLFKIIGTLTFLVLVSFSLYFLYIKKNTNVTVNQSLEEKNNSDYLEKSLKSGLPLDKKPEQYTQLWEDKTFKTAENLSESGNYERAIKIYTDLLQDDVAKGDTINQSQIKIRIASLLDASNQKEKAIKMLLDMGANNSEYFITRAFAYEYLARMVYETRDRKTLEYLKKATNIKTDDSVDEFDFVVEKTLNKSEDIAPLYLALSQKMVVGLNSNSKSINKALADKYKKDLLSMDRMMSGMETEQNVGYMIPLSLLRKAKIAERLEQAGGYSLPKTVEQYYLDAVSSYDRYGEARRYNYVYYEYARYLANKYGTDRKTDIEKILKHFKTNVSEKENLSIFLLNIQKKEGEIDGLLLKEYRVLEKMFPDFI